MTEPTSFKSHNFNAVNEQILQIAKREKARTFAYRLKSFQTIFMYAAVAALIIAFLMLATAWAKRIISAPYYPPKIEIVRPEVIEKEVIKVVQVPVERSIMETSGSGYEGPDVENTNSNTSSGGSQVSVVTNFTTFKTVSSPELSTSGISIVVTGWQYEDSESKYPESQYCYTEKSTPGRTKIRIELGEISKKGEYSSYIDSKLARETLVSQSNLEKALAKCQWASTSTL